MLLCHQKPPDDSSVPPKNIDGGEGGEEKHFYDLVGVSIQRNGEIRSLIAFVSTSFVHDCSLFMWSAAFYKLTSTLIAGTEFYLTLK